MSNTTLLVAAVVLIIGAILIFEVQNLSPPYTAAHTSEIQPGYTVPLMLTDPPVVPHGTTALVVDYANLSVRLAENSTWLRSISPSGTADLMQLLNASQIIGDIRLPRLVHVDGVEFNITSTYIILNGTRYNVSMPGGKAIANMTATSSNDSRGLLLDLLPVVSTGYANASSLFILSPALTLLNLNGSPTNATFPALGSKNALNGTEKMALAAALPSISVENVSVLAEADNVTHIFFTVTNHGKSIVMLQHVGVIGREDILIDQSAINATGSAYISASSGLIQELASQELKLQTHTMPESNGSTATGGNTGNSGLISTLVGGIRAYVAPGNLLGNSTYVNAIYNTHIGQNISTLLSNQLIVNQLDTLAGLNGTDYIRLINISHELNMSVADLFNLTLANNTTLANTIVGEKIREAVEQATLRFGKLQSSVGGMAFYISQNGTLVPATSLASFQQIHDFTLQPGQSAVLSFTGGFELASGGIVATLAPGSEYYIVVQGPGAIVMTTNVTATST